MTALPGVGIIGSSPSRPDGVQGRLHRRAADGCRSFAECNVGYMSGMPIALILIIVGIALAVLVHYALGIVVILIGLVMLLWPHISKAGKRPAGGRDGV